MVICGHIGITEMLPPQHHNDGHHMGQYMAVIMAMLANAKKGQNGKSSMAILAILMATLMAINSK